MTCTHPDDKQVLTTEEPRFWYCQSCGECLSTEFVTACARLRNSEAAAESSGSLKPLMEEDDEPTVESELPEVVEPPTCSSNVVNLREIKNKPRQSVIDALEIALERAHSGELQGVILLLNQGASTSMLQGGFYSYTDMIMAFKDWEFTELAQRNLVCPGCGHDERSDN